MSYARRACQSAATRRWPIRSLPRLTPSVRLSTQRIPPPRSPSLSRSFTNTARVRQDAQTQEQILKEAKEETRTASDQMGLQSTDLLEVYQSLVTRGVLKFDEAQVRCVMELRKLLVELQDYRPPIDLLAKLSPDAPILAAAARRQGGSSWFKSLMSGKSSETGGIGGLGAGDREKALVRVLSGEEELSELNTPKGILLTGPPGTGKSYLLSLFFSLLPTTHKARHHYHPFLLTLYQSVWKRTQARMASATNEIKEDRMDKAGKEGWRSIFAGGAYGGSQGEEAGVRRVSLTGREEREGISFGIAKDMILEYHILYFDELQLVDASSASLLRDILSWYWRLGGIIIATSNRLPDDLYHHGVQRDRMASFLEALKARCTVYEVNGGKDFRLGEGEAVPEKDRKWFGMEDRAAFEKAVEELTGGKKGVPSSVNVYGRKVRVPWTVDKIARFTFAELCDEALATADYISICSKYETIIIDDMPLLYLKHKNQARRLINLVDALYESRCKVLICAEDLPENLFFPDALEDSSDLSENNESIMAQEALTDAVSAPFRPNISMYESEGTAADLRENDSKDTGDAGRMFRKKMASPHPSEETSASFKSLSIFTGEDERFAYRRAVSRLIEMTRSPTYSAQEWLPVSDTHRRWEKLALSVPPPLPAFFRDHLPPTLPNASPTKSPSRPEAHSSAAPTVSESDFADEAGYSRSSGKEKGPPVISQNHVWGMAEWEPKAGAWGKGPAAKKVEDDKKGKRSYHSLAPRPRTGLAHVQIRHASQSSMPRMVFPAGPPQAPPPAPEAKPSPPPTISSESQIKKAAAVPLPSSLPKPRFDYRKYADSPKTHTLNHVLRASPIHSHTVPHINRLYQTSLELSRKLDACRAKQRDVGILIQAGGGDEAVRQAKKLKVKVTEYEKILEETEKELLELAGALPNETHPETPVGKESEAIELERFGPQILPADPQRDHLDFALKVDWLDPSASATSTGNSWAYLKGGFALLEMALVNYAVGIAVKHGWSPVATPDVVKEDILSRCGFQPRDPTQTGQTYFLNTGSEEETSTAPRLALAATAEVPLAAMWANKVLPAASLPLKVVGMGKAFRAEAGARGADTRGLYRLHQFTKVELFAVTEGAATSSDNMMEEIRAVQKEIYSSLGIPVRVLDMPTEELGASAYRKYDMEAWMPGRGKWGEISSTSNCTDYQARRLHIRHRQVERSEGESATTFAHTLNGTAAAIPRLMIALVENGLMIGEGFASVLSLPKALQPFWVGGEAIGKGEKLCTIEWS